MYEFIHEMFLNSRGFFFGCVKNIKYGSSDANLRRIDDIPSQRSFVVEGNCNLTLCDKPQVKNRHGICHNRGVCKSDGKGFATCDCRWTGYDGPTCTDGKTHNKSEIYLCFY